MEKEKEDIKDKNEDLKLTESQLDLLYFYLNMNMDSMGDEELALWHEIMEKVDKNFHDS